MSEQNIKKWIAIILTMNVVMFSGGFVIGQLSTQINNNFNPMTIICSGNTTISGMNNSTTISVKIIDPTWNLYVRFYSTNTTWFEHDTNQTCWREESTYSTAIRGWDMCSGGSGGILAQNGSAIYFNFDANATGSVSFGFSPAWTTNYTLITIIWQYFWNATYTPLNHWGYYNQGWHVEQP